MLKEGDIVVSTKGGFHFKKGDEGIVLISPDENPLLFDGYIVKFGQYEEFVFEDAVELKEEKRT